MPSVRVVEDTGPQGGWEALGLGILFAGTGEWRQRLKTRIILPSLLFYENRNKHDHRMKNEPTFDSQ